MKIKCKSCINIKSWFEKYKYEFIVVVFFVVVHLPSLGNDNFNTDVWRWKARSYDFSIGVFSGDFNKTLAKYHPGVTLMWLGTVGIKTYNLYYKLFFHTLPPAADINVVFQLDFVQKLVIVIAIGVLLSFAFYVLRNIFNLKFAALAVFLLTFEPFYLGLTRVIHLEGLVSTLMLCSIVWLYYYFLDTNNIKRLVLSGIFAGFAVLTKISAAFLIPFCGLITLIYSFQEFKNVGEFIKKFSKPFFIWLCVLIAVFFVFWPAMWVEPLLVLDTIFKGVNEIGVEGEHIQFYFGNKVDNPGLSFYFVVLGLKSSVYLLLGFIGSLILRKKFSKEYRRFLDFLLIFILFFFIQLIIPTKKLDRYILPALVMISMCSSIFYIWVIEKLKLNTVKVVLAFVPLVLTAVYVHPDYFSYFNPMFGGLRTGVAVLEPKWEIGTPEIIKYFKNLQEQNGYELSLSDESMEEIVYRKRGVRMQNIMAVSFEEKYYTQIWPFFRKFGAWAVIRTLTPFASKTRYFVYPVWDDRSALNEKFTLSYFDTIKVRGVPVYRVYLNENYLKEIKELSVK